VTGDLLVRGGDVLAPDGSLRRADVLVCAGLIAQVGAVPDEAGVRDFDASGSIVIPGLVNAHTHSGENFNPGRYENLPLDLWFVHSHQVTRTEPPPREEIYVRTMLGAMLMLRSGTSCAVDFVYEAPEITLDTLEPVVQAYRDSGLRATVLLGVADKPFLDSLPLEEAEKAGAPPEAPAPTLERIVAVAEGAIERWHDPEGTIQIGIAPSAPQRCTDELLEATWRLAEERDVVWHTHALETKTQAYTAGRWHGRSFVEVLAERGYLGRRASIVHAVWLTDRDVELFRETDATMIHCLLSNLRLGDGIARLPALQLAGVRVALGTDGRGCDETLDMFELTKMTALVHKARGESHRDWPTAADVFAMATRDASICTGHGERLGRIEPGAHGDLVLIPRDSLPFTPLLDPVRQLVYGAPSREVATVVVGGRVVVEGGRVVGVDEKRMLEVARRYAPPPADPGEHGTEAPMKLQEIVSGVYERAERSELGLDSYIGSGLAGTGERALL
jgi:cytosine/adenosine deaminase-related metal-dependent hydrolase